MTEEWIIYDEGDQEFTGDYDVWIGTEREDGTGDIVCACWRERAALIASSPKLLACLKALLAPMAGPEDFKAARAVIAQAEG